VTTTGTAVECGVEAVPPADGLRSARRAFHYFLLITAFHGILGRLVGYFLPVYFRDLGFSGVQTGLYFSVSTIATLLLSLPMGISTDRKSIAGIFMFASFLGAVSYLGLIFTRSFAVFCGFALIGSIGGRFYGTANNSMFFKISRHEDGHDTGVYQLISFVSTGLGMLTGSLIIAAASFRHMFIAACLGNVVLIGLSYFLPRTETVVIRLHEYRKEVLTPRVLFITFVFMLSSVHWGAESISYGRFLMENLGLTVRQTGLYTSVGFVVVGLGAYLGVVLLRYRILRDLQAVLMLGFLLAGVFHVLMCVRNPWLSFSLRMVHELGDGLVFLAYYNGIAKIFHVNKIGGCAAFMSLCTGIASMASAVLFGWVGDRWGHQWPLIISGIVMALLPVLLAVSRHKISEPATAA